MVVTIKIASILMDFMTWATVTWFQIWTWPMWRHHSPVYMEMVQAITSQKINRLQFVILSRQSLTVTNLKDYQNHQKVESVKKILNRVRPIHHQMVTTLNLGFLWIFLHHWPLLTSIDLSGHPSYAIFSANNSNVWKYRNFNDCCLQWWFEQFAARSGRFRIIISSVWSVLPIRTSPWMFTWPASTSSVVWIILKWWWLQWQPRRYYVRSLCHIMYYPNQFRFCLLNNVLDFFLFAIIPPNTHANC